MVSSCGSVLFYRKNNSQIKELGFSEVTERTNWE
jgi:hypothetical protein